jgi:hypothetical protein
MASTTAIYPNSPASPSTKNTLAKILEQSLALRLPAFLTRELVEECCAAALFLGVLVALCMVPA